MKKSILAGILLGCTISTASDACTRVFYATERYALTAYVLDWYEETLPSLHVSPRGVHRSGATAANPKSWSVRYGNVATWGREAVALNGLNEAGLAAGLTYDKHANYGVRNKARPGVSANVVVQAILDNFESVAEAVAYFQGDPVQIVADEIPGTNYWDGLFHFSISDRYGDSAVIEYRNGRPVIYHDAAYTAVTNEPAYNIQLARLADWRASGEPVPGSESSTARFIRATYYAESLPEPSSAHEAVVDTLAIARKMSNLTGVNTTRWRSVADNVHGVYYFDHAMSPFVVWVVLDDFDMSAGEPVLELDMDGRYDLAGRLVF